MPRNDDDAPVYIDDTHQRISEFAADFLDEEEREDFVDSLLERHGYERNTVTTWNPPQQGGGAGGRQPLVKPTSQRAGGQRAGGQRQGQGGARGSYFGGKSR